MPVKTTRVTFADYMEQALYGPGGYYASGRAHSGRNGDYFTAPDVGPAFATLLGAIFDRWLRQMALTAPSIIEAGAGEGGLALALTPMVANYPYIAVERSPVRQEKLRASGLTVFEKLEDVARRPVEGVLFANELLDAFPVHRVRWERGKLQEGFVEPHPARDGSKLLWRSPSTPRLAAYFQRLGIRPSDDYQTEVNLAMADWFKKAASALARGLVCLIDYGRPAHEYYAPERNRGTLRGFSGHRVFDPLDSTGPRFTGGDVDLTVDVDFTSAALDARAAGFVPLAFMEMGSFLLEGVALLDPRSGAASLPGLKYLIHPDGLGSSFHVLILGKGVSLAPSDFPHNRLQRLGLRPEGDA